MGQNFAGMACEVDQQFEFFGRESNAFVGNAHLAGFQINSEIVYFKDSGAIVGRG